MAVCRTIAAEARSCGLWGDTPDGPAECSFGGYSRSRLVDCRHNGARMSWALVTFGPVRSTTGVSPSGWALFDENGVMLHRERAEMGPLRRRLTWNLSPGLRVVVE